LQSVDTDCPHREKLGWLEVPYLMARAWGFNYDLSAYFPKLVRDMREAQTIDGLVPDIAPEYTVFPGGYRDSPEWGSAVVMVPWYAYASMATGVLLEESLPAMARYVDYLAARRRMALSRMDSVTGSTSGPGDSGPSKSRRPA